MIKIKSTESIGLHFSIVFVRNQGSQSCKPLTGLYIK